MDYGNFSEKLKELQIKQGLANGLWKKVAAELPDDSNVVAAGVGVDGNSGSKSPVVITDEHIYVGRKANLFGGFDFSTARREDVRAVDVSGTLVAEIRIGTAGGEINVKGMPKKQAQNIARVLR